MLGKILYNISTVILLCNYLLLKYHTCKYILVYNKVLTFDFHFLFMVLFFIIIILNKELKVKSTGMNVFPHILLT